jgi:hypothetical protein
LLAQLNNCNMAAARITMVGVWDTVGSLGIPSLIGDIDPIFYGFLDTGLSPAILNAYHALAIDEKRCEFPPTLWTTAPAAGQVVEQVWFVGVHSDIGGGEPDDLPGTNALSDITLTWMMNKASALGLKIDPAAQSMYPLPMDAQYSLDTLHTSWNVLCGIPRRRSIDKNAVLANSVQARCQHDSTYRPENLLFESGLPASQYGTAVVIGPATRAAGG